MSTQVTEIKAIRRSARQRNQRRRPQGRTRTTGNATFNNTAGPIVADPFTHNVYAVYAAGEAGIQKGTSANFNNIFVSRSTDDGQTWTANHVYRAPLFTALNNVFPALAVDPTNGKLYAVWSDAHSIFFSASSDQGSHWSPAVTVNIAPASTALSPWVAAHNGIVDVVYYATTAASKDDPSALWNVYLDQTTNDGTSFAQSLVSNTPNHVGVVCTSGTGCAPGTRNLLDLFEVAINIVASRATPMSFDLAVPPTMHPQYSSLHITRSAPRRWPDDCTGIGSHSYAQIRRRGR
jgi:hypothetical protein